MLQKIGEKLQSARKDAGFNQEDIARELGISRNKMINVEKGEGPLDVVLLSRIAHLYGCSIEHFIDDSSSENQDISFAYRASELGENQKDIPVWGKRVLNNLRDLQSICREAGLIGQ
jgi:transcriptional regulator with XRE-family HTH domain